MKIKACSVKLEDVSEEGAFEGYASVFGIVDTYGEVVEAGAFEKSLKRHTREKTKPKMLWQHDAFEPIGVWESLEEDTKGLRVKGRLLKGLRRAEEAQIMLREKVIEGLSIGYREVRVTDPTEQGAPRILREVDLREVSIVTFGANRRALVDTVKSERMEDFARRLRDGDAPKISEFEDLLRDVGIPKSMAVAIASHGYAKAIRRESEGEKASDAVALLRALRG